MVFVKLHQNRRGHHQEVSEGHGDGVGHHGEALTQTAQTLKKETRMEFYKAIKIKQEEPRNTELERYFYSSCLVLPFRTSGLQGDSKQINTLLMGIIL